MQTIVIHNGTKDPGAVGNDALIMRNGKPIAGLRGAEMTDGIIYGSPLFHHWGHREMLAHQFRLNRPIDIEIRHPRFGTMTGKFRVVSCEANELSFKQVD